MGKKAATDERSRLLRRLRHRRFQRYIFVGQDALVIRAPETGLPPDVQAQFGARRMCIYPVTGGYMYKWPRVSEVAPPEGFELEPKGWDHEHCDACNRTIKLDRPFWATTREPYFQLCPDCRRRVRTLAGPSARQRRKS